VGTVRCEPLVSSDLEINVRVFERPFGRNTFCPDARIPGGPEEIWRATRGTVTIELSPPGVHANVPSAYRATIRIVRAEFISAAGVRVRQTQPITLSRWWA